MSELPPNYRFLLIGSLAAVLASVCCVGPLLLLMLGVGGAWLSNLTALEPYRPIFIVISLLTLVLAGQNMFRSRPGCPTGESCSQLSEGKWQAVAFWAVSILVLSALMFPYLLPLFY